MIQHGLQMQLIAKSSDFPLRRLLLCLLRINEVYAEFDNPLFENLFF